MRLDGTKLLMAVLLLAPYAVPAVAADNDDLAKALDKTAALEKYTFQVRAKAGDAAPEVEGAYQKGQPAFLQADRIPFYRAGDVLVYKQGDNWQRTKRGIESDPLAVLGASAKAKGARLPHEEVSGLARFLKGVAKGDKKEDDCAVYTADLTEDGAKKLAPVESQDVAKGGTVRLWVNGDGAVVKYALTIRVQGKRGNAEVNGTLEKVVKLGDIGTAKVEVPEAARKALE